MDLYHKNRHIVNVYISVEYTNCKNQDITLMQGGNEKAFSTIQKLYESNNAQYDTKYVFESTTEAM